MYLVSFSLFLDAFSPRPKMPFTYVVNVYSDMSLSKGVMNDTLRLSEKQITVLNGRYAY